MDDDIALYEAQNTLIDKFEARGYGVIDARDKLEEMDIDLSQDYYDDVHTNIHGSAKYTTYVTEELIRKHSLAEQKKGNDSWEKAFGLYEGTLKSSLLDFEIASEERDGKLEKPELTAIRKNDDGSIGIEWNPVGKADAYLIYRKTDQGFWQRYAQTDDAKVCEFKDEDVSGIGYCKYTVVPFRNINGQTAYGNYDYRGIEIQLN
jgi:hypothetical protein